MNFPPPPRFKLSIHWSPSAAISSAPAGTSLRPSAPSISSQGSGYCALFARLNFWSRSQGQHGMFKYPLALYRMERIGMYGVSSSAWFPIMNAPCGTRNWDRDRSSSSFWPLPKLPGGSALELRMSGLSAVTRFEGVGAGSTSSRASVGSKALTWRWLWVVGG